MNLGDLISIKDNIWNCRKGTLGILIKMTPFKVILVNGVIIELDPTRIQII